MKRCVKYGLICLSCFVMTTAMAQQEAIFSQYMFNGLILNPAYAGSKDMLHISAIYRDQWAGIEGAPRTYSINMHSPLEGTKVGVGLTVFNDKVGVITETGLYGNYAFRFSIGGNMLAVGLKGGLSIYKASWEDIKTVDPGDPAFTQNSSSLMKPNFGLGVYYNTERFYVGASSPRIFQGELNFSGENISTISSSMQSRHIYLTAGHVSKINKELVLKPSVLVKYVKAVPLQIDFNVNLIMYNMLWLGASFRSNNSMVTMIEYKLNPQLRVGYAVDTPLRTIRKGKFVSHELMVSYEFAFDKAKMKSPRYF